MQRSSIETGHMVYVDRSASPRILAPVTSEGHHDVEPPLTPSFDVALRNGRTVRLRPIRASDGAALDRFHHHLSAGSIYSRYFSLHPDLSPEELRHLTQVDYVDRFALVVEDAGELVAVGRYERYPGTRDAEVAFVVRDDYQHLGLGHLLLEQLALAALARQVTTFRAETLAANRGMLSVFLHSGFEVTTTSSRDEVSVRFRIDHPPHTDVDPPVEPTSAP